MIQLTLKDLVKHVFFSVHLLMTLPFTILMGNRSVTFSERSTYAHHQSLIISFWQIAIC